MPDLPLSPGGRGAGSGAEAIAAGTPPLQVLCRRARAGLLLKPRHEGTTCEQRMGGNRELMAPPVCVRSRRGGLHGVITRSFRHRGLVGPALRGVAGYLRDTAALEPDRRQDSARADAVAQPSMACHPVPDGAGADHIAHSL